MKTGNSTLKSFKQLKLITSPDKYFLFLWNNVYEFLGTNYCMPQRWPKGPFKLSLPPLAQTSSYGTGCKHDVIVYTQAENLSDDDIEMWLRKTK